MKILLLTYILLSLTQSALAIDCDELVARMPEGLLYEKYNTQEPYSGLVTGRCAGEVSAGLQQGEWLEYHPNMQIKTHGKYVDSKKVGEWLEYYDNGQLKTREFNADGLRDGQFLSLIHI